MNEENKSTAQRKRAQNFSEKEKLILTDLMLKYKNIIENKRTDGITSKDKEKCWKKIENIYNSTSSSAEFRSSEVLKSCWENLKKKTRKFFAEERIQLYKTGGGPCESRSNVVMERVRDIIKPSVDGIISAFDSDAIEGQSTNSCKISTNKNSCEMLTNIATTEEWLYDDDNITHEKPYEHDVLDYLKQNAGATRQDSFDNVSDTYETSNYEKENDINGNDSESDVNENRLIFENNKQNVRKKNIIQKPREQDVQDISAVQILQKKISTPLQANNDNILNNLYGLRKRNRQDKPYKKKEDTITSGTSQYDMLIESKIKFTEYMTEDFKAKSEVEIQILNIRLKKEELEMQILQKELLLQENRLERELQ